MIGGASILEASGGLTIVGLEHQPYLREITTIAVYSGYSADGAGGNEDLAEVTERWSQLSAEARAQIMQVVTAGEST